MMGREGKHRVERGLVYQSQSNDNYYELNVCKYMIDEMYEISSIIYPSVGINLRLHSNRSRTLNNIPTLILYINISHTPIPKNTKQYNKNNKKSTNQPTNQSSHINITLTSIWNSCTLIRICLIIIPTCILVWWCWWLIYTVTIVVATVYWTGLLFAVFVVHEHHGWVFSVVFL